MLIRRSLLALPLIAFLATALNAWTQPQEFDALGQGPFPVEATLLPGIDPDYYDLMLCSPLDTRCGVLFWGFY